jgi:hypothetical protein
MAAFYQPFLEWPRLEIETSTRRLGFCLLRGSDAEDVLQLVVHPVHPIGRGHG